MLPKETWSALDARTGGLSKPSKMPCHSWSIPAEECAVGSLLRKIPGSTCSGCYALKGNYKRYPKVGEALRRRLAAWRNDRPGWVLAMAGSIGKAAQPVFRWFDSGDLQGVDMLRDIVEVCELTPQVNHWLPTRERDVLKTFRASGGILPDNLTVRLSAPMVGAALEPANRGPLKDIPVSMVHTDTPEPGAYRCPAPDQKGKCLDCRACWTQGIAQVSYAAH